MNFIKTFKDGKFKNSNELMDWIIFGDDSRFYSKKTNTNPNQNPNDTF